MKKKAEVFYTISRDARKQAIFVCKICKHTIALYELKHEARAANVHPRTFAANRMLDHIRTLHLVGI